MSFKVNSKKKFNSEIYSAYSKVGIYIPIVMGSFLEYMSLAQTPVFLRLRVSPSRIIRLHILQA